MRLRAERPLPTHSPLPPRPSATLTRSPGLSSSLPLAVEGVSSPCLEIKTKSSLLRVETESEETLIFPTEALSSMTQREGAGLMGGLGSPRLEDTTGRDMERAEAPPGLPGRPGKEAPGQRVATRARTVARKRGQSALRKERGPFTRAAKHAHLPLSLRRDPHPLHAPCQAPKAELGGASWQALVSLQLCETVCRAAGQSSQEETSWPPI